MSTLFTKIVNGEIPAYKIIEDDNFLAFLDVNPNAKGHTLCIPKKETNKIFDIEDQEYLGLMQFAKKVAVALERKLFLAKESEWLLSDWKFHMRTYI